MANGEQGRPTKYKPEYDKQAYKLCLLGYTDDELADFFDVHVATVNQWKISHPSFHESLKKGKEFADTEVVESLYNKARGAIRTKETDIKVVNGEIVETVYEKQHVPDTTAQIFWLKNRQPKRWRDKQEVVNHGGDAPTTINLVMPDDNS